MLTKTKAFDAMKAMELKFRAMQPGDTLRYQRGECVIEFTRGDYQMYHQYLSSAMTYSVSFRECAKWFTEDDGLGVWTQVK